jgi:hypothetical protein
MLKRSLSILIPAIIAGSLCLGAGRAEAVTSLGWYDIDPTITIQGTTTAATVKGSYTRPSGAVVTTTDAQLTQQTAHAKEYDGPTRFTADYSIDTFGEGVFESGTVTFTTIYFTWTHDGTTEKFMSNFTTEAIPITGATFNPDGSVASFTFYANNWYPETEDGYDLIINHGLQGTINLKTGMAEYMASYQIRSNAAVDTFTIAGRIATPEPATWAMLLVGFAGLGFAGFAHGRRGRPKPSLG